MIYSFFLRRLLIVMNVFGCLVQGAEKKTIPLETSIECGIEIGSGMTRMSIAEMAQQGNIRSIVKIIEQKQESILYAHDATQNNNRLSEEIYQKGLALLKKYQHQAEKLGAQKIYAVATDVFRTSVNGKEFIERLNQELGIKIDIISQDFEGKLGLLSIAHTLEKNSSYSSSKQLIGWDSGSSSAQLSTLASDGSLIVYKSPFGFVRIKAALEYMRSKQDPSIDNTSPFSSKEIANFLIYVKNQLPEAPQALAEAISSGIVVRKFSTSKLTTLFETDPSSALKKNQIWDVISKLQAKLTKEAAAFKEKDEENLLRMISLYIIMDKLDIPEFYPVEVSTGNTYGILLSPPAV